MSVSVSYRCLSDKAMTRFVRLLRNSMCACWYVSVSVHICLCVFSASVRLHEGNHRIPDKYRYTFIQFLFLRG